MTTEIKAAIAGAIEALEEYRTDWRDRAASVKPLDEVIATLRRIEFVEGEKARDDAWKAVAEKYNNSNGAVRADTLVDAFDHLTTTGHAIVKMGDV